MILSDSLLGSFLFQLNTQNEDAYQASHSHVELQISTNFPAPSATWLKQTHHHSLHIGYRFILQDEWSFLVRFTEMKYLRTSEKSEKNRYFIALISEEFSYMTRLHEPFYLLMGGHLTYLYPLKRSLLEPGERQFHSGELGGGAQIEFAYFRRQAMFMCGLRRWQGSQTRQYPFFELSCGMGWQV